ncbi:MAG: FkbM family methyltransferase [Rhodospirillales bacterium]|nr:FkbM family methyltransferase [Alphaproteobacteria bacterium]MCB9986829.1 FkbM family methyltransferase [Rhodospirillales bacterium]USO08407.1 MAG: FkbM family methyltransferase [Rhodospirillales bacterium]
MDGRDMTPQDIARDFNDWLAEAPAEFEKDRPVYLFGRTPNSDAARAHLSCVGVIDDFAAPGTHWNGLPVFHGDALPRDAIVINTALHRYPVTLDRLAQLPSVVDYAALRLPPLPPVAAVRAAVAARPLDPVYERLDDAGKKVLYDVMRFRLTGDKKFMATHTMREAEQYFDVDLRLSDAPVFVDGGAYHGENTRTFCTDYPHYGAVHLFEPGPASMDTARATLAGMRDTHFHPCALGARADTMAFESTAGLSSKLTADGDIAVRVARMDDEIPTRVDFIKLDLEGAEPDALAGAARLIRDHHPALAVCVYHAAGDLWDVPARVLAIRDDYDLTLRHYTQGWNETVMYFMPR